jgi:uncharacterized protein YqgC (DUF456 family)
MPFVSCGGIFYYRHQNYLVPQYSCVNGLLINVKAMDVLLAIVSALLLILGIIGSIIPGLPGPPLSWLGILLIHFTSYASYSATFLIITAIIMLVITVLDYYIPIWGTKKFGGTRAGVIGSTVGLLVGLIFSPFGLINIILGPFVGAFIGEMMVNSKESGKALKSATGSFIGFLLGTGMKLAFGGIMAYYYIAAVF